MLIQDLKILIEAVEGMAGAALYLVVGFILYKLIVFGSTTGAVVFILKLLITKLHSVITSPKIVIHERAIQLDDHIITHTSDDNAERLLEVIRRVKTLKNTEYLHKSGVDFIIHAIEDKLDSLKTGNKK